MFKRKGGAPPPERSKARMPGWIVALFLACLPNAIHAQQAQAVPGAAAQQPAAANPGIVKLAPSLSATELAKRPDTDLVELSEGRRVKLGDIRRLRAAAAKLQASPPGSRLPKAFRVKPAPTGTGLSRAADLSAALQRSDGETVVLPSGRRTTVGMIRMLQPEVEKRLGRPLSAGAKPADLTGPAVKVDANADWKAILQKPDATVLEAPNGSRITVWELKKALSASGPAAGPAPVKR